MRFTVLDDGVDNCRALSRLWMTDEEPIFHAQLSWSHRSLSCIIVNGCIWVVRVATQVVPDIECIFDCLVGFGFVVESQKVDV